MKIVFVSQSAATFTCKPVKKIGGWTVKYPAPVMEGEKSSRKTVKLESPRGASSYPILLGNGKFSLDTTVPRKVEEYLEYLSLNLERPMSSTSASASDLVGPDKHVNIKAIETLSAKIEKAAAAFRLKVEKQDKATMAALLKAGAKTPKQIEKALSPVGYFYINAKAKPVPYSAAKAKAKDTTYLRQRAIRVMSRVRPSANALHKLVLAVYSKAVVGAELYKQQQTVQKAITAHTAQSPKTSNVIKDVRATNLAAIKASFGAAQEKLVASFAPNKIKESQMFVADSAMGQPAMYLTFGKDVLVVRPSSPAMLRKAKAAAQKMESTSAAKLKFNVGTEFASAVANADETGIDDRDSAALDKFMRKYPQDKYTYQWPDDIDSVADHGVCDITGTRRDVIPLILNKMK